MPEFFASIRKELLGYRWVNRYQITASSLSQAEDTAYEVYQFERAIHSSLVHFELIHTSPNPDPGGTGFHDALLSTNGLAALGSIDGVAGPQVCTFVELAPEGTGRPGKKFYRYSLTDAECQGAGDSMIFSTTGPATRVADAAVTLLASLVGLGTLNIGAGHRAVGDLIARKPAICDTRHGWYNRAGGA